ATPVLVPIQLTNVGEFLATLSQARGAAQATISGPGTNLLLPGGLNVPKHKDGGLLDGPGNGTSDSILARDENGGYLRVSKGEFIVNAEDTSKNLPLLKAINNGMVPAYATGRVDIPAAPGYNARSPLTQQALGIANRGGSVEQIRALVAAYDDYLHRLDQAAQREGLLQAIHDAQVAASKAKAKERAGALQQVADAQKALQKFDAAAYADSQKAATDRLIASLEKEAEKRQHLIDLRDNAFAVGKVTAAAEVAGLTKQMAALETYSSEWTSLYQKRQQILDDQQAKAKTALDDVNRLLDAQAALQTKVADSKAAYAKKQTDLLEQQRKAETDFYAGLSKAAADHAQREQQILTERRNHLADLLDPRQLLNFDRGLPANWLVANAQSQLDALQQWMDQLQTARGRGVSEQVISALGLDQGPQALYQVKALTSATAAEIDQLNAAVAQGTALAGEQVRREQVGGYGQLGAALVAEQQQYATAVAALQDQFRSQQADLAKQLQDAQTAFLAEQSDLATQLAAIGSNQGRSYGEALAAGLASQIPAVKAAADALAAAAAGSKAASSAAGLPGKAAAGAPPKGTAGTMTVNGQLVHVNAAGIIDTKGAAGYGKYPSQVIKTATFDTGGLLQPGFTLAFNGTGAPERVMTRQQEQARGETVVQFQPYAQNVIREQVDMDLLMRRAEFLVTTGSF
ncbi:MAG: hypothetical protein JWM31_379, partial [Solirubrobacterales bacterium]|nr:hypothetical protein [Solirubrobacterales bacterium]